MPFPGEKTVYYKVTAISINIIIIRVKYNYNYNYLVRSNVECFYIKFIVNMRGD